MKKFFPVLLMILVFSGFLTAQIIWDFSDLGAQQVVKDDKKNQLFESLFQQFKYTTIDNKIIETKSLKTPIVVKNFWASWCVPCLKEFPSLVKLQEKFNDKISIIAINGDEEEPIKAITKTKEKYKLDFFHLIDPDSSISDKYHVSSYPFSLIYVHGALIYQASKNTDFVSEEVLKKIESALKNK